MERDFALDALRYNGGMGSGNATDVITILGMEQRAFESWVAIGIFFIGFIFLLIASFRKNQQKFIAFGLGTFIVGLLYMFIRDIEFRNLMLALSSIIALVLSYLSFLQSERIRKDNLLKDDKDRKERLDRESRNQKERLLNEIIEWAIDASRMINDNMIYMDLYKENDKGLIEFICNRIDQLHTRGQYVYELSKIFSEELEGAVDETNKIFKTCIKLYIDYKKQQNREDRDKICKDIFNAYVDLGKSTKTIIEEASAFKIEYLQ
jgi:hypothetical protein